MALDGIVTRAIVHELQACIGARIHKIHQPTSHDLVLQIRGAGMQGKLLLSANPTYPRVHWTTSTFVNPLEAPMFCMLIRKYCEGGLIEDVRQVGTERIIHFRVRSRDELGDVSVKTLVIELMGRHSNIILLDEASGTIHDGIHHVTPAISSYRIIMPGTTYVSPPQQGKADPLSLQGEGEFLEALQAQSASTVDKLLVASFSGISPLLAKEVTHRSGLTSHVSPVGDEATDSDVLDAAAPIWPAFHTMMDEFAQHSYHPQIVTSPNGKAVFSVTSLTHIPGESQSYSSISECLEAYYGDKAERDTVKQRVSDLIRFLQNERNKNEKKLEKLAETLVEAQESDKYRILGELLTAYMHQIQRGDKVAEVVNYYDEEQQMIRIPLDPQLNASDNAQRYFKKYTKMKNSLIVVDEQMVRAKEEIQYLESLLQQLESASLADIDEIREELVEQGYLRDRAKRNAKKRKKALPALLSYQSTEGIAILVGKNNTQNDFLTNKVAAPNETWLHTKDIPGSHVVIRSTTFGDATLEEAAMLAAHYSQARDSSLVPVDYTLVRHVKKPSGAKPGFVIYDHQKTLFITPNEQRIKQWTYQIKS